MVIQNEEEFSGSYAPEEVSFLMKRIRMETTVVEQREKLIQSGQRHYSEMIGPEDAPSRQRMKLFRDSLTSNSERLAQDLTVLAAGLATSAVNGELTLVSIARGGTPIGVLLWHRLRQVAPDLKLKHYSISVIRDRGVDYAALRWIAARHSPASIRFVDGWTGKGTIADELRQSIAGWRDAPLGLDPGLWVPLDVCGAAAFAASSKDYLIPSTLLGGTLSGLVSRSILPGGEEIGVAFHSCVPLDHLRRYDISNWFIAKINSLMQDLPHPSHAQNASQGPSRRAETAQCLAEVLARHQLTDRNRIKLGIGETVRVLLRRLPHAIWLGGNANPADADLIRRLAAIRNVSVKIEDDLAFDAIAVIATA
jgi:hypothetical protein